MNMAEIITVLVEDIGLDRVFEDNDLTEDEVIELLINEGRIDLNLYQLGGGYETSSDTEG
jgi:hypothetical protein